MLLTIEKLLYKPVSIPTVKGNATAGLAFSYGVHPVDLAQDPHDWRGYAWSLLSELGLACRQVLLVAGPPPQNPEANQRLELMVFDEPAPL